MTGTKDAGGKGRAAIGPLRSVLYIPGSNDRALAKVGTLACDAVILDLEDAVAPQSKALARQAIRDFLAGGGAQHRLAVPRINRLDSDWGRDDLAAFVAVHPDALLVPKVEDAADIIALDRAMTGAGYGPDVAIWAMMETPRGVLNAQEIACASQRLKALVVGTNDLAKDMRLPAATARMAMRTAFGLILLAARAAGLAAIDGVFGRLGDEAGFLAECEEGRALGFDGKTLIHPQQIAVANRLFAPDPDEIALARRIVAGWDEDAEKRGIAVMDGRMVEKLHVEEAQRLLDIASAIAARAV
ncbi:MAG: (3S)-malyl-CoA thioesterase [Rhodothalassiaceae bacterium]